MFLGSSGSGKTYLQEKVSELIPKEDKIEITQITENAFYYFRQDELQHKLLLIEDLDGAQSSMYPLRELQSKRRISKTVTLKDTKGNLKTITLTVEGPVSVSGCTTREKIYEDNANRCLLVYIDTSKDQDKRIMEYQARISAGEVDREREEAIKKGLQNMQRVLKPVAVVNPLCEIHPSAGTGVQAPADDGAAAELYRGNHPAAPIPAGSKTGQPPPAVHRDDGGRYRSCV